MMNVLRVKVGGELFLFLTVAFASILFALAGCGTAHDNFKNWMQLQVGRDLFDRDLIRNRHPEDRGGTRTLPNGNLEEEFLWNRSTGCRVSRRSMRLVSLAFTWQCGMAYGHRRRRRRTLSAD